MDRISALKLDSFWKIMNCNTVVSIKYSSLSLCVFPLAHHTFNLSGVVCLKILLRVLFNKHIILHISVSILTLVNVSNICPREFKIFLGKKKKPSVFITNNFLTLTLAINDLIANDSPEGPLMLNVNPNVQILYGDSMILHGLRNEPVSQSKHVAAWFGINYYILVICVANVSRLLDLENLSYEICWSKIRSLSPTCAFSRLLTCPAVLVTGDRIGTCIINLFYQYRYCLTLKTSAFNVSKAVKVMMV